MKVCVVEDDAGIGTFLDAALSEAGNSVRWITDGAVALRELSTGRYDLIVLDVVLPNVDGFEICRRLRSNRNQTPILIITAKDTLEDKIEGLDCGADDYLVKPFQMGELLARCRALLRRRESSSGILISGDLSLDLDSRVVHREERTVSLSATEFSLLEFLMRNEGRVLTREQILDHVWQYDFDGNDSVIDVYICYLRSKIDKGFAKPMIITVRGLGYRLESQAPD